MLAGQPLCLFVSFLDTQTPISQTLHRKYIRGLMLYSELTKLTPHVCLTYCRGQKARNFASIFDCSHFTGSGFETEQLYVVTKNIHLKRQWLIVLGAQTLCPPFS